MPFYEVIYETGSHSVACYDSDDEALSGIAEHHRRAASGEPGGPTGHPAERIVKVLRYDRHPVEHGESQLIDVTELNKELGRLVAGVSVGDLVSVPELAAELRTLTNPMVDSAPHDSNYKATETGSLDPSSWAVAN